MTLGSIERFGLWFEAEQFLLIRLFRKRRDEWDLVLTAHAAPTNFTFVSLF